MIRWLVGFDTTSARSNLDLIHGVRDYLAGLGVDSELIHDETGTKANLWATLGPAGRPGVVLSGHTDVVPVTGQAWDGDPFTLTERDGRLYGRGTADMKSFLACCLAAVPEFLRRGLATPIHLAFSYDEEVGCLGVRRLLAELATLPVRPSCCIVGEPTGMRVVTGHKGRQTVRVRVRGVECHSAQADSGVNAIEAAAAVIARITAERRRRRLDGPHDPTFDPPYTTLHTGVIQGGTALNIVPRDCSFEFEVRALPGEDPAAIIAAIKAFAEDELLPAMRAVSPASGFSWETLNATAGLDSRPDDEVTRLAAALSGGNATGRVSFTTEAGLYQRAGIPTVVCGPGFIEDAHKPNEFIALDQVAQCEAFLGRLMDRVCRP